MAGVELANAWVNIVPSTNGIAPAVKKALGQAENQAKKSGKSIGSRLSSSMGKSLKLGAASVGAAAAGALGTALTKGFKRLNAFDAANAKFRGLGKSAEEITTIMDGVNKAVTGTVFGLDEAAGSAAKLSGVGVQAGQDMNRMMTLTADIAAQAGLGMSDVDSVMAKIIGSGKLTGETLAQLDDAATGASGAIAKHLNVSIEEMRKMVSNGEIDVEEFASAMEEHLGGAAQSGGDTFAGAVSMIGSAMGRLGATILEPSFSVAPKVFSAVTDSVNDLHNRLKPLAETVGEWVAPQLENLAENIGPKSTQFFDAVEDMAAQLAPTLKELGPSLGNLASSFATVGQSISAATWKALGDTLNALAPVIQSVVVPLVDQVARFTESNPGAVQKIVTAFLGFKALKTVAGPVGTFVKTAKNAGGAMKFLSDAAKTAGKLPAGVTTSAKGLGKLSGFLVNVAGGAKSANPAIAKMGGAVRKMTVRLAKVGPVAGKISGVFTKVAGAIVKVMPGASKLAGVFGNVAKIGLKGARMFTPWGAALTIAGTALHLFFTKTEVGRKTWARLVDGLKSGWEWMKSTFSAGIEGLGNTFSGLWDKLQSGWQTVTDVFGRIKQTWGEVTGLFTGENTGTSALASLIGEDKVALVVGAIDRVKSAFQSVSDIASSVGTIISATFNAVKDTVGNLANAAMEAFKDAIATGWTVIVDIFTGNWAQIGEHLAAGWESIKGRFAEAFDSISRIWESWLTGVKAYWEQFKQWLGETVGAAWQNVKQTFSDAVTATVDTVSGWYHSVTSWVSDMVSSIGQWIAELPGRITGFFVDMVSATVAQVLQWRDNLVGTVQDMVSRVSSFIAELPGKIQATFAGARTWLVNAGRDILNGLWDGLKRVWDSISTWFSNRTADISRFFGNATSSAHARIGVSNESGSIMAFADGGQTLPRNAKIQRPVGARGLVQWAEAETGGEAFIPLAASKRDRSTKILAEVANRFGMSLVGRDGQTYAPGLARDLAPTRLAAFADGGITARNVLDFVAGKTVDGKKAPRSLEGAKYTWGGGLLSSWGDCSGMISGVAAFIRGIALAGRKFATMSEAAWLSSHGFRRGTSNGKSAFEIGVFNGGPWGGHTSGTIYDDSGTATNIEMGGGRGNGQIGGRAAGSRHSQYTDRFWTPLATGSATFSDVESTSVDGMTVSGGSAQSKRTIEWGTASKLASEWDKRNHRENALRTYLTRAKKYDTGGLLPTGGVAVNLGKPEVIFPAAATKSLTEMMRSMPVFATAVDKLAEHAPGVADALDRFASTDFRAIGSDIAATVKGDAANNEALAGLIGNQLAEKVTTKLAFIGDQMRSMADGRHMRSWFAGLNEVESVKFADEVGNLFGYDGIGKTFGGVAQSFVDMEDAAIAQVDAADAVTQAEKNLAEAREELAKMMAESPEVSKKTLRRVQDAEAKVAEASKIKDATKRATAMEKAEKSLARVREDAADELEKNGVKSADALLAAQAAVTDAEQDHAKALGVVEAAARATGQTQVQMVMEIAKQVIDAFKWVFAKVGDVLTSMATGWAAVADSFSAVAQFQKQVRQLRVEMANATLDQAMAQIKLAAAFRNIRITQMDATTSWLSGAVGVAKAEKNLRDARAEDARRAGLFYEGLGTSVDYYRHNVASTQESIIKGEAVKSDATRKAEWEVFAARAAQIEAQKQSQLDLLEAQYASQVAAIDLKVATIEVDSAVAKLAAASKNSFGMDKKEATTAQRWASLQEEKARLTADQADWKTFMNPVAWFTTMPENQRRIRQIDRQLKELEARDDFNIDEEMKQEAQRMVNNAGAMSFFGLGSKVAGMVSNSKLGDPGRALDEIKFEHELVNITSDAEKRRLEIEKKRQELANLREKQRIEDEKRAANANKARGEAMAERYGTSDPATQLALQKLADAYAANAVQFEKMAAEPKVVVVPANKTAFTADEVIRSYEQLGHRVERLENPQPEALAVAAARR